MSVSKAKQKKEGYKDKAKKWSKDTYEKNKLLTTIFLFIIGIVFVGIFFKIVNKHLWVFISLEIILVIGLVLVICFNKKAKEMWKKLPKPSKALTIIIPLLLIGSTAFIGTFSIAFPPTILQIGKTTNPVVSTMDDPLVFLWDDNTTSRVHTLVVEAEGETLVSANTGTGGDWDVGQSSVYIEFYSMDNDSVGDIYPQQILSKDFDLIEIIEYCSNEENGYYTNFYWNSSGLFVPELGKTYVFYVTISDYEGDITEGEQWFYYLEDIPLNIVDYKWVIIGSVFGTISIVFLIMIVLRKKKRTETKKALSR